jgi:hypothetical protein
LNIKLDPVISIEKINIIENDLKIKFPQTYVFYLTKIQNGGSSDKLHEKGPYYGIYSLEKSIGENNSWGIETGENFEIDDDLEIEGNEELIKKYQHVGTINGTMPICEYGDGDYFRIIITGKRAGEIFVDSGTIDGFGYYFMNVDILTFYENWLDREIIKSKDPSKKLINASYSVLEFGNTGKYKIVEPKF